MSFIIKTIKNVATDPIHIGLWIAYNVQSLYPSMSISNSIAVLVKGRAIHLSYVDRHTDVFC